MKNRLLISLAILVTTISSFNAQFVNYEDDKGWNLGFNIGGVWQRNDFKYTPKGGLSAGLTFGKSLYEKEGAFLAFDLRFRYLGGWNRGWSTVSSTFDTPTSTITGYNNYRLSLHEYTLEGVLTLNSLRERTGILIYGFGGVGLTNYTVKANYLGDFGSNYDYSTIDGTQSPDQIVKDLERLQDNSYETTVKETSTDFMPSLGFGIGYQFPYHFSMGVEHKVTYALSDNKLNNMPNGVNDKYLYSAVYFRWNLFGSGRGSTYTVPTNTNNQVNNYTTTPTTTTVIPGNKPLVNIVNPATNNQTVQNSNFTIRANVYYVSSKADIVFKQNGIQLGVFSFNPTTNQFSANVVLQPGNNVFEVVGSNSYGSDQDSKIIILRNDANLVAPPIITITNPPYCPFTTSQQQFVVTSTILNVANANQISFKVNGINSTNFNFNPTTKVFSSNLTLIEGTNTIQITATNARGTVSKSCTINHIENHLLPPVVTITYPATSPYNTTNSLITVNGTVLNVINQSQINVLVNGVSQSNFTYDFNTKKISFPVSLIQGTNIVQITGTNAAGIDSKSTTIIYTKPTTLPPPVVSFVTPSVSPFNTTVAGINVQATVLNVVGKPNITVKHNGAPVTNFSFNTLTKLVSFNAVLVDGSNVFEVKGVNTVGNDIETTNVIYKRPLIVRPPVVTITNPSVTPYTTNSASQVINATILNVNNANNVTATFNGVTVNNFVYNPLSTQFSYTANLVVGANTLLITGTNAAGTASKTQTIIYSIPPCDKPTLVRTAPASSPQTTSNSKGSLEYSISNATSVIFKINGQPSPGYNFNQATGKFTSLLHLTEGATTYEVIAKNECGSTSALTSIIYEPATPCVEPSISLINPAVSPFDHVGRTGNTSFTANVANTSSQNMISVKLNNTAIPFSFNAATGNITGTLSLAQGTNTISISATNECGSANSDLVINYAGIQNQIPPPLVTITNPNSNPFNTNNATQTITATVLNVAGASNISAFFNGNSITNFTYNTTSKVFSYNANLVLGTNTLVISGTNTVGTDSKTQTINYTLPCSDPTVSFAVPIVSASGTTSFTAIVGNVSNQNMINVTNNGTSIPFTFDANTNLVSGNLTLSEGNNVIAVTATNNCGSDAISHTVTYTAPIEPPCVDPRIRIISAVTGQNISYNFNANISNITDANNVVVTLNGNVVPSTFNINNGSLIASITLEEGNNTIVVQANECNGATETFNVYYTAPCDPVTYNLILPNGNSATSAAATYMIKINTANVPSNANISVAVNGNSVPFTFNANSGMIDANNIPLQDGDNSIVVTIGNDCSSETISYTISYTAPVEDVPCTNPIINVSSASSSSQEAYNLTASVSSISDASNVVVTLNGAVVSSNYNTGSGSLTASLTLNEGNNSIQINANECDGASQTFNVIYTLPCTDPVISFAKPTVNSAGTTSFYATVLNVTNQNMVSVTQNGNTVPFTFESSSGLVSVVLTLVSGDNVIVISGGNACGTETSTQTIVYTPVVEPPCVNPVISISSPSTSNNVRYNFTATISNITVSSNVVVLLNGSVVISSFNMNTGALTASLMLTEGDNIVTVEANECDGVSETLNVNYTVPCNPVTYNLILPNGNSATSAAATYMIKINTSNVPSNANITVSLNGTSIPFTFNANSGMINASNIPLQDGDNSVVVTIGNDCSNESISYTITYDSPIENDGNEAEGNESENDSEGNDGENDGNEGDENDGGDDGDGENDNDEGDENDGDDGDENNGENDNDEGDENDDDNINNGSHASEQAINSQYTNAINKADMYYNVKKWATAKTYYEQALKAKPNERYPQERIAAINAKLKTSVYSTNPNNNTNNTNNNSTVVKGDQNVAKYNSAISKGDMYYNAKNWTKAKTYYQQAAQLKPNASYPKEKIAAINQKLKVSNYSNPVNNNSSNNTNKVNPNVAKYNTAINKADMYYNAKKWSTAKTYYQQARNLMPNEKYPKEKLALIEVKMKESKNVRPNNTTRPNNTVKPHNTVKPNNTNNSEKGRPTNTTKPTNTTRPKNTTKPANATKPSTTRPTTTRPNATKPTTTQPKQNVKGDDKKEGGRR